MRQNVKEYTRRLDCHHVRSREIEAELGRDRAMDFARRRCLQAGVLSLLLWLLVVNELLDLRGKGENGIFPKNVLIVVDLKYLE